MIHVNHFYPRCLPLAFIILTATLLPGCGPEPITSRKAERPPTSRSPQVDAANARLDHMLAAVVRQGDQAWFFKMVASAEGATRHGADFQKFLASLNWGEKATRPSWDLPEGWEEKPSSGMRAATLVLPDETKPIELTVTSLPVTGTWDEYLASNVNRWVTQLGQASLSQETVEKLVKKITSESGQEVTWMELVGVMTQQQRMGGASLPEGHPPMGGPAGGDQNGQTRPPGKQDRSTLNPRGPADAQPATAAANPLECTAPEDWQPSRTGGMRKAAFLLSDGNAQAEVTVIDLPTRAGPGVTDVTANVSRWAGQVGLADLQGEALAAMIKPVQVDGTEGKRTLLLGPEKGDRPLGLLAVMFERGDKVWFIKMIGDRKLVDNQQQAFDRFLETIKFK
jgi:hypothetical protein